MSQEARLWVFHRSVPISLPLSRIVAKALFPFEPTLEYKGGLFEWSPSRGDWALVMAELDSPAADAPLYARPEEV